MSVHPVSIPRSRNDHADTNADRADEKSWTQGFFAGLIWTLVERLRLLPKAVNSEYTEEQLLKLARRWQDSFRHLARPALNHDQGFRFQLSYG